MPDRAALPPGLVDALLESSADAIYLVDPEGHVAFANTAALDLLGYEEHELLGRPSHPTIHFQYPDGTPYPQEDCPMLRPRATGETVRIDEDWFTRKDGRMVPVAYSSAPLQMPEGRGAVVVFRDISDRRAFRELQASRARIVETADAERRRLGRDLHDGAQQRLVHVLLTLQKAAREHPDDTLIGLARTEVQAAIGELRELAQGIHPSILTNRGLEAAIDSLTSRSPVPVQFSVPATRWPATIEGAAYFVIAEALTNVAKYAAEASEARVNVTESADGWLEIEVSDDGPGGADPSAGSGLRGLDDRVAAFDGELDVESPPGAGTTIRARLPLTTRAGA